MASTPRTPTPAPERPPPLLPLEPPLLPLEPPPPVPPLPLESPPPDPSPSTPREEYHTPPPSLGEASPREGTNNLAKSPQLSPMRLPSQPRPPPPGSHAGQDGQESTGAAATPARPQLRLTTGLVRTPSHGSVSLPRTPSPSPSPTPPSPLTPATPAPPPAVSSRSGPTTPRRAEAWKPPSPPAITAAIAAQKYDPAEEAVTSPLRVGKDRLDHQQRAAALADENGGAAVPPDVAAVAAVGERRSLSVALRLATAALSLAAFSVMVSARTSGWAGDYYGRHEQYRYAVAVNVIVCAYSIAQTFGEIRRLISPTFIFRSMSSYYCSLFLDQVLAYLLMSASSAAASRHDLWVSRFGGDPFNKKINSAVWLSFLGLLLLVANALISTANLFSML